MLLKTIVLYFDDSYEEREVPLAYLPDGEWRSEDMIRKISDIFAMEYGVTVISRNLREDEICPH